MNEYDQALESDQGPKADPNEYETVLTDQRNQQRSALQGAVTVAADTTPDRAADVQRIATSLKVHPDFVERNYDDLKKTVRIKDAVGGPSEYDKLLDSHPKVAQWLSDPSNAAVSYDDIDKLKNIEQVAQDHGMLSQMGSALMHGIGNADASLARVPGTLLQSLYQPQNMAVDAGWLPESWRVTVPNKWVNNPIAKYYDQGAANWKPEILDQTIVDSIAKKDYGRAGQILAAQVVANAPQQAMLIASMYLGHPGAGLVTAGATTAASKYGKELEDNKIDKTTAMSNALAHGVIEAGFENLGTFGILHKWEGEIAKQFGKPISKEVMKSYAKAIGHSVMAEGNEEFMTQIAQDFSDQITGAEPGTDYSLKGYASRSIEAGLIGAASGGTMTSAGGLMVAKKSQAYANHAALQRDFYLSMGKSLEASALRERLPEAQRKFVDSVVKDSPVEKIYIPIEAFETHFQGELKHPAAAAQDLGVLGSYNEAKQTGGSVEIPLGQWAEKVVGTPDYTGLADDVKFSPNDQTVNEWKAESEKIKAQVEEQAKAAETQKTEETPAVDHEAVVRDQVEQQLLAAGVDPAAARDYAATVASGLNAMGQQAGTDASSVLAENPLTIGNGEQVGTDGQVLNQSARSVFRFKHADGEVLTDTFNSREEAEAALKSADIPADQKAAVQIIEQRPGDPMTSPLGFYSQLRSEVDKMDFKAMPAKELANYLSNPQRGLKREELEHTGIIDWLTQTPDGAKPDRVTKQEVIDFLDKNGVQLEQIALSDSFRKVYTPEPKPVELHLPRPKPRVQSDSVLVQDISWDDGVQQDPDYDYLSENAWENIKEDLKTTLDPGGGWNNRKWIYEFSDPDEYDKALDKIEGNHHADTYIEKNSELKEELLPEYTDEDGNVDRQGLYDDLRKQMEQFVEGDLHDQEMESQTQMYWDNGEGYYEYTESETGHTLMGHSDLGEWYSDHARKHFSGTIEAAQQKFLDWLIEHGEVSDQHEIPAREVEFRAENERDGRLHFRITHDHLARNSWLSEGAGYWILDVEDEDGNRKVDETLDFEEFPLNHPRQAQEEALRLMAKEGLVSDYDAEDQPALPPPPIPASDIHFARNDADGGFFIKKPDGLAIGDLTKNQYGRWQIYASASAVGGTVQGELQARSPEAAKEEALRHLERLGVIQGHVPTDVVDPPPPAAALPGPNDPTGHTEYDNYTVPGAKNYREFLLKIPGIGYDDTEHFGSTKGAKDFVVHVRTSDRVDTHGHRVLFIEEIQSDLHKKGREYGYKSEFRTEIERLGRAKEGIDKATFEANEKEGEAYTAAVEYISNKYTGKAGIPADFGDFDYLQNYTPDFQNDSDAMDRLGGRENFEKMQKDPKLAELRDAFHQAKKDLNELMTHSRGVKNADMNAGRDLSAAAVDAPYKQTDAWVGLAFKRMLHLATQEGFDAVGLAPGEVHSKRWGTDTISWAKAPAKDVNQFEVGPHGDDGAVRVTGKVPDLIWMENAYGEYQAQGGVAARISRWNGTGHNRQWALFTDSGDPVAFDSDLNVLKLRARDYVNAEHRVFASDEEAKAWLKEQSKPSWIVGSLEQMGGDAGGVNIEEALRQRGERRELHGERVSSIEDLRRVAEHTLSRTHGPRTKEAIIQKTWKAMQTQDVGLSKPRKEGIETFYDDIIAKKSIPAVLKKLDKKAKVEIGTLPDVDDRSGTGAKQLIWEVVLTPELKQKVSEGQTLFQPGQDGPRGQIRIGKNGMRIDLLKGADLSTFIHETGHFYLQVMDSLTQKPDASQQIKDDYATIREYLGLQPGEAITENAHEKFARSWEAYHMEGKAPSDKLRQAFIRFSVWLTNLYKKITSLGVELTPEVRAVFDRMLATPQEIAQAQEQQQMQPLFGPDPAAHGMTGDQAARYMKAVSDSRDAAEDKLRQKFMQDIVRQKKGIWKHEKAQVTKEIEPQVRSEPAYQAIEKLQTGEHKIDRDVLVGVFGEDIVKKLPRGVTAKGGIHPDVLAEGLRYGSGNDLVNALLAAKPVKEEIAARVEKEMNTRHPEFLSDVEGRADQAMQAVHNDERAKVLRMELEHLADQHMATLKDVIRKVARRVPTDKMVRAQAEKTIGSKAVKEIRPAMFQAAERKAAGQAGELLAKGDLNGAFEAKQRELLNHELYRAAVDAQEQVDKAIVKFKKIAKTKEADKAKVRDMDMVNAAKAILATYGIGKVEGTPQDHLKALERYAPETFETMSALVDSVVSTAGFAQSYKDISYNGFQDLATAVNALWDLSRSSMQNEIDGKKVDRQEQIDKLNAQMSERFKNGPDKKYTQAMTKWEKTQIGLMGMRSALRRVESWVDAMDGGDPKGLFRTIIWNPIVESISKYRLDKKRYIQKYLDVVKGIEKSLTQTPIVADEIAHKFANKAELLHAILHTGNESNKTKLLAGRNWGTVDEEGNLDSSRWDAFVKRAQDTGILTKADYNYAQAVWDLNEELKTKAQLAHKEMYGFFFGEVTKEPFVTKFGSYRGGYVPAIADPFLVEDAHLRNEKEALEKSNNSFMFPTAGRGFTKKRVEAYTVPLALDLRYIPAHMDKVLRFIHIEPRVKEVGRIVINKEFRAALAQIDPTAGGDMLMPWLQRSVQQKVSTSTQGRGGQAVDAFFREVRTRTGLNMMVGNVVNTLQQFTGGFIAAVKVHPKHLTLALWRYVRGPGKFASMVAEKSEFMQTKLGASTIEIQQTIDDLLLNPTKYEKARDFAKKHGYFFQQATQNIVDTITWGGGYDQAIERGASEKDAVREADAAVRQTQGTFAPEDMSRFEGGTPFIRAFTQFYSYFNMQGNLLGTEFANITRKMGLRRGAGKMLYVYTMGFMIPAVLSEVLVRAFSGKGLDANDDDDYLDDILDIFFGSQRKAATALLPGVGTVINAGFNAMNDKWYDDRMSISPAVQMIESAVVGNASNLYKAMSDKGDGVSGKKVIRDALSLIGLVTGMPVAPLAKPLGYLADVNEGKAQPTGPIDFTRGLVTGKAGGRQ